MKYTDKTKEAPFDKLKNQDRGFHNIGGDESSVFCSCGSNSGCTVQNKHQCVKFTAGVQRAKFHVASTLMHLKLPSSKLYSLIFKGQDLCTRLSENQPKTNLVCHFLTPPYSSAMPKSSSQWLPTAPAFSPDLLEYMNFAYCDICVQAYSSIATRWQYFSMLHHT